MSAIRDIRTEIDRVKAVGIHPRFLRIRIGVSAGKALLAGLHLEADKQQNYRWPNHMPLRFEDALIHPTEDFPGYTIEAI